MLSSIVSEGELRFGREDDRVLESKMRYARAVLDADRAKEAVNLFQWAVCEFRLFRGFDDSDTLTCRSGLAQAYQHAGGGYEDDAEGEYTRLLQDQRKLLGPTHLHTLRTADDLASLARL